MSILTVTELDTDAAGATKLSDPRRYRNIALKDIDRWGLIWIQHQARELWVAQSGDDIFVVFWTLQTYANKKFLSKLKKEQLSSCSRRAFHPHAVGICWQPE